MADGNIEQNKAAAELAPEGAEAVGNAAMEKALNDVRSDNTTGSALSKAGVDSSGKLGIPELDVSMHEAAHAGIEAMKGSVKGGAAGAANDLGQAAIDTALGAGKSKGGAEASTETPPGGKPGEQINEKDNRDQEASDMPRPRSEALDELKKWIDDQGSNLNQKDLADKLLDFAKNTDFQWKALDEMGEDDGDDRSQLYSRFTDLLLNKLTDQGERERIKDQIPWSLAPGE